MKRLLALLLVTLLVAAACGGGSSGSGGASGGSSSGDMSATDLLKASQDALKGAKSASFELTVAVKLDGNLEGAGAGAAFLQGPLSLSLKGQAGKADGPGAGKFDVHFALNFTGGSFSGEALSPDGKTAYIQMPTLLGPGWKSIDISKQMSSSGSGSSDDSTNKSLEQLKALGLDPSKWLKNLTVSTSGEHRHDRGRPRLRRPDRRRQRRSRIRRSRRRTRSSSTSSRAASRPRTSRSRSTIRRTCRARSRPSSRSTSRPTSRRMRTG